MIRIQYGVSIKHPFFLGYVVITESSGKFIQAGEQSPVDEYQIIRRERKGSFRKHFGNPGRNLVRFLCPCILCFQPVLLGSVITVNQVLHLVNGDIAFDMSACGTEQILRWLEAIYILQPDSRLPYLGLLTSIGFSLSDIFVEISHIIVRSVSSDRLWSRQSYQKIFIPQPPFRSKP